MKRTDILLTFMLLAAPAFAEVPDGYYSGLEGLSKDRLKEAAKQTVRKHNAVDYGDDTWNAFSTTDVRTIDGTDYWWDMYSDVLVRVSSGHPGLNIEHSVANSWWGKTKNDAYKDLFHLNPSNAEANSHKSNYPLGIVAGTPTYDNGVTRIGHPASGDCGGAKNVFEPADCYKGDFARAFFYIFTVYDDIQWMTDASDRNYMFDGSPWPSLREWAYTMLLKWAADDPVDNKERQRNEAVYAIQHNRNPYIDIPELADYVWGSRTSEPFHYNGGEPGPGPDPDPDPNPDPDKNGRWERVMSMTELSEASGGALALVDSRLGFGLTATLTKTYLEPTRKQAAFDADTHVITSMPEDAVSVTLTPVAGGYAIGLQTDNGISYISSRSAKKITLENSAAADGTAAEISIDSEGVATIDYGTAGRLCYNASSPRFTTYTSTGQTPLCFYRLADSGVRNIDADKPLRYHIDGNELTVPSGAALIRADGMNMTVAPGSRVALSPGLYILSAPGFRPAKIFITR